MKRILKLTDDGSHTLYLPEMDENYHSTHGAIQESKHVFIEAGLKQIRKKEITVFEVGFGTGLNALLTLLETERSNISVHYIGIEKYPLNSEEYGQLNYADLLNSNCQKEFQYIHQCEWNSVQAITDSFRLYKLRDDIISCSFADLPRFDLIYFDAFAPNKQDGVWDIEIFRKIQAHCNPDARFVTYCAKGSVRRDLQEVGFKMERIPGPPGKKEMLTGIN
ncbi:MAG: tRNA (5-methylaminomethyl-2-thiouridine)(34)-methyltransferase MnmD [Prolixibacteraceae bacterium]